MGEQLLHLRAFPKPLKGLYSLLLTHVRRISIKITDEAATIVLWIQFRMKLKGPI